MEFDPEFRYDLFPIPPTYSESYLQFVHRGRENMQQTAVVLAGLCRNIEPLLPVMATRLLRTAGLFAAAEIVIYVYDSNDGTRTWLSQWQRTQAHVTILGDSRGDPINANVRCLIRASRMAMYRNALREHIVREFDPSQTTHVLMIDLDVLGGWSLAGLANTFGHAGWDFVGSNGVVFLPKPPTLRGGPVYYDVWSTRWHGSDAPLRQQDVNPMSWENGSPFVPVNSCFGGLGVYRIEAFHRSSYAGTDVEHVPFHRGMRESGLERLFMNPSQIVHYGGEPAK